MTQHYLSDEQIAAERADIASLGAFFHRFDGEEHVCVPITHWRQRSAAIAAYAAQQAPIDMVLHCPKCGMQHVDMEEFTDFDRGPNTPPGNWKSWDNPPHRSHLCHACDHIWRPADVPTNGVQAVKTTGKADSPIAHPATGGAEALAEALQEASRRHYATDQATTPEFMDWLATQARREGVAANEAWNAGAAWARAALASPAVKEASQGEAVGTVYIAGWNARDGFTLAGALDQNRVKEGDKLYLAPPTPAPAPAGGSGAVADEFPHQEIDATVAARYRVVDSEISVFGGKAITVGDGTQQVYHGRNSDCVAVAAQLRRAFADGAFFMHDRLATPSMPAPATGGKGGNHG